MEVSKLTINDINRRVAWQSSPHLDKYGTLKAFMRGGEVIIELDASGKKRPELKRVLAKDVRFI